MADGMETQMFIVPEFCGREVSVAQEKAKQMGLEIITNNPSGVISWQCPEAGRRIPGNGKIAVVVRVEDVDSLAMADLTGMNLRTAISMLNYQGIDFEIIGSGVVEKQEPLPGTIDRKRCEMPTGVRPGISG